ncbi:MAG: hypothetical protein IKR05_12875 [Prevotella sp.]|nr:hypothetical protein [Prevotella sp.]
MATGCEVKPEGLGRPQAGGEAKRNPCLTMIYMKSTTPKGWQSNDMTCMKLSFCHPFGVVVHTTLLAGVPCFALHRLPVL